VALGIADRVWSIGDLIDAALATQPISPVVTAPDRRRRFQVILEERVIPTCTNPDSSHERLSQTSIAKNVGASKGWIVGVVRGNDAR
jgi:hypothetical protein